MTLQNNSFLNFQSAPETPTNQAFSLFQFVSNAKTIEWSTVSSWAASCVAVRGPASLILSNGRYQILMAEHCTSHLQGSCLFCKTS